MKYMITWHERPMGSATDYEQAQKRILSVFKQWKPPESVKIIQFLVRVGEYGGFMLIETDSPAAIHRLTSTYPAFQFHVDPVLDVNDAVAVEIEAITWRDAIRQE
jgi:hypothetical protein